MGLGTYGRMLGDHRCFPTVSEFSWDIEELRMSQLCSPSLKGFTHLGFSRSLPLTEKITLSPAVAPVIRWKKKIRCTGLCLLIGSWLNARIL